MADPPCRYSGTSSLAVDRERRLVLETLQVSDLCGEVRELKVQMDYFEMFGDVHLARPQVAQAGLFDHLALIVGV